jgi:hypothetical protein
MGEQLDRTRVDASGSVRRTSPGAKFAAGIVAGMIGGILMIGFMMGYAHVMGAGMMTPLKALGAFESKPLSWDRMRSSPGRFFN